MKNALVVIDMQNDFITGALGSPDALAITGNVAAKIREAVSSGADIYLTRDTHNQGYMESAEGRHLPVAHCIEGTQGWQIAPAVTEALADAPCVIIDKPSFGSLELAGRLTQDGPFGRIEIAGLVSSICVVSNALIIKAALPETEIYLDASCTAGVGEEDYRASLTVLRMCHINVTGD